MNIIVVYPGRFHPFHLGHKASYDWLTNRFGEGVYIATSDVQNNTDSPFTYTDKVKMMTKLGIPSGHIVKTRNPYQVREITDALTPEEKANTALVFAVSAKDAERFSFRPKKNGEPSYLQPLPENLKKLKPMSKAGYVVITPTVNFRVKGVDANSASQIRKLYLEGNDNDRIQIIMDLYGSADKELKELFDTRLGVNDAPNIVEYGAGSVDGDKLPGTVGNIRESRINRDRLQQLQEKILANRRLGPDYVDEKISR